MQNLSSHIVALFLVGSATAFMLSYGYVPNIPLKNGGNHWALLVAGSNSYFNYRHQADVCHAYHVLKDHGVPEENIIVMMYDDVAYSSENPTPGVLINRPNGENVYSGVKIDYKGEDVTPEIFLSVLQGKKKDVAGKGTGRVIDSGPNDHVFVNFVDHGAPGLVAFPDQTLKARDFMKALKSMHANHRYNQMVIYIEACESGSMFKGLLPENMRIYATTAASSTESSYACYYDDKYQTYLGDLYSVKWMENSDVSNLNKETLQNQYKLVKKETNMSHVQEFGEMSLAKEPVGDFQGNTPSARNIFYPELPFDAVETHNAEIYILRNKLEKAKTETERRNLTAKLESLFKYRDAVSVEMKNIVSLALNDDHNLVGEAMSVRSDVFNFDCYEPIVDYYFNRCRDLKSNMFSLRLLYALQNVCNTGVHQNTIISAIDKGCPLP